MSDRTVGRIFSLVWDLYRLRYAEEEAATRAYRVADAITYADKSWASVVPAVIKNWKA